MPASIDILDLSALRRFATTYAESGNTAKKLLDSMDAIASDLMAKVDGVIQMRAAALAACEENCGYLQRLLEEAMGAKARLARATVEAVESARPVRRTILSRHPEAAAHMAAVTHGIEAMASAPAGLVGINGDLGGGGTGGVTAFGFDPHSIAGALDDRAPKAAEDAIDVLSTKHGCALIDGALWDDAEHLPPEVAEMVKNIDNAFEFATPSTGAPLVRGTDGKFLERFGIDPYGEPDEIVRTLNTGRLKAESFPGYLHAAKELRPPFDKKPVVLHVETPIRTPVIDMSLPRPSGATALSEYPGELEMLFERGTLMHVVPGASHYDSSTGKIHVGVRILP